MKSLLITDQKDFTSKLFGQEIFDNFLLAEAEFITSFRTEIRGLPVSKDTPPTLWASVRPVAYRLLAGDQLPRRFHVALHLSEENAAKTVRSFGLAETDEIPSLFVTIVYEKGAIRLVTGSFSLDKTLDDSWDLAMQRFLKTKQIEFTIE